MIESLHVAGFKLFRDLTLPKLGQLNLFVGENNTGKSCLLEAVGLYAGREPLLFNKDISSVAYLPPNGFIEQQAASLWNGLVQGPGQDMVIDWLRILEPTIEGLAYVGEAFQRSRTALLKLESESCIPLRSMGDGMTKLFHVALAAASSSRGFPRQLKLWDRRGHDVSA